MQKIAVVFGSSGGIGQCVSTQLVSRGYSLVRPSRKEIDLSQDSSEQKIINLLKHVNPTVVVNAAGVYDLGADIDYNQTMNVNFRSNWAIVKHYMLNTTATASIVMIGSSSYRLGKSAYPLYSASKAALYNLWQSSADYFKDSNVNVHLINPVRTRTNMVLSYHRPGMDYLEPSDVATKILDVIDNNRCQCVDMTFKETK